MTAPVLPAPRVSDEYLNQQISRHELSADGRGSPGSDYMYDLRDARAALATERELRRTAEARGFEAGRDAAVAVAGKEFAEAFLEATNGDPGFRSAVGSAKRIGDAIARLTPPAPEGTDR